MKKNIYIKSKFIPPQKIFWMNSQDKCGFTLVELLLYLGLSSVLIIVISGFLSMLLQARIKNQAIGEVEQQGLQVMQIMTQAIRNASAINFPTQGVSTSSLSLDTSVSTTTPMSFNLSSGGIRITEGTGGAVALTNSRIVASNLIFSNLSYPTTHGIIRIQFTLTYKNPSNISEFNFQKTFITSGTLR